MTTMTVIQLHLVSATFSFTAALMAMMAAFLATQRSRVQQRHQLPVTLLALIMAFAAYTYIRMHESWGGGYAVSGGGVQITSTPFNELYRYAGWLVTAPLLLTSLVLVLDIPYREARVRSVLLALLGFLMIVLSYPGLAATTMEERWIWFGGSMVPFVLIWLQLFVNLGAAVRSEPQPARVWVKSARVLMFLTWSCYPIVFSLPMMGITGTDAFVATQVGYAVGDLLSKGLFGLLVCIVATSKAGLTEAAPGTPRERRAVPRPVAARMEAPVPADAD